jgi:hypothetical protein
MAQQPPHRGIGQLDAGEALDDHGDPIQGPHSSGESVRQRALQQRLLDRLQPLIGDLGTPAGRPTAGQCPSAVSLPAGVPAARTLARDLQLVGDLGLGATLGKQLGGPFPTG